jgi:hypothetical protein
MIYGYDLRLRRTTITRGIIDKACNDSKLFRNILDLRKRDLNEMTFTWRKFSLQKVKCISESAMKAHHISFNWNKEWWHIAQANLRLEILKNALVNHFAALLWL